MSEGPVGWRPIEAAAGDVARGRAECGTGGVQERTLIAWKLRRSCLLRAEGESTGPALGWAAPLRCFVAALMRVGGCVREELLCARGGTG